MISAFGIEHGVISKSMIKPGVYRAASSLSGAERTGLKAGIKQAKAGYADDIFPTRYNRTTKQPLGHAPSANAYGGRKLHGKNGPRWGENRVEWKSPTDPGAKTTLTNGADSTAGGRAFATSNRGTGVIQMYGKPGGTIKGTPSSEVLRHERRHIAPKRNPVRWRERRASDLVRGREEGRADFGVPRDHEYGGSPEFRAGYEEVQRKMAAARRRKQ